MDHEAICNCPFMDTCETYADDLVPGARKGPDGLGCAGASDTHRREHCKTFACRYLTSVFADMIRGSAAPGAHNAEG